MKSKLIAKLICIILALLMVAGSAYTVISMVIGQL